MTSIGSSPRCPESAHGHIQKARWLAGWNAVFQLMRFAGKHGRKVAPACFDSGNFLWPSDWCAIRPPCRPDVKTGARFTAKHISGTAPVLKGGEAFTISENPSTCIPLDVTDRLENSGIVPIEMIEVPSGSYPDANDVVPFDTIYGRN